jgi:opacity protein-like surface antigen
MAQPSASRAADGDKPQYELGLYVWGTSLAGDIDTPEGDASMHISFSDLLKNVNLGFMGRGRANFDKLSIVLDAEYFDLETDKEQRTVRLGPQGNIKVPASAKVELLQYILELNAGYEVLNVKGPFSAGPGDERGTAVELYAGGRYISMKPEVKATFGSSSADIGEWESWVDAVVGARIGIDLSKTVVLGIQGDVGGFNIGNSDKFAWSQITSLSWDCTDSMTLALGYKFLDIKREPSSDVTIDLQLRGPFIATFIRF